MANNEDLARIRQGAAVWNDWRAQNRKSPVNLNNADLGGVDRGPIKRLIRATLGFKPMKTAYATLKGFEVMRMIRRRQCIALPPGIPGQGHFIAKLFNVPAC